MRKFSRNLKNHGMRVPTWDLNDGYKPAADDPPPVDPNTIDDTQYCEHCARWIPITEKLIEKIIIVEPKQGRLAEKTIKYYICEECSELSNEELGFDE